MRKIYDWVLSWADSPYGVWALFFLAFSESVFFPIPPDILLIALAIGARKKSFHFAGVCLFGSILGAITGYFIGSYLWWSGTEEFSNFALFFFDNIPGFTQHRFETIQGLYDVYNFWIIFTAGFTPIPYKIFTLSGGAFDIGFIMFLIASICSRGARFFLIASLIWKFGKPITSFIDKYFNLLAILFTVLLIGGFVLIKYVL